MNRLIKNNMITKERITKERISTFIVLEESYEVILTEKIRLL